MCAVGDLHRVHDSTQAQRADRSTRVLQRSSTPCQRQLLCAAQRSRYRRPAQRPRHLSNTFQGPEAYTWDLSLREKCRLGVEAPVRKNFSGTDKSPRNANIAHIQLGAVVCPWCCLFTASIFVMARITLTHRTGRCSNSCAFSQRIHKQSNEITAFHGYTSQCRHTRRIAHDVSCARRNPKCANFQVARTLQGLWCAHLTQLFYTDCRGHDLHSLRKTARSPSTVTACQLAQQSTEDGLWRGADGWQPKKLHNSIWQGKPACWG